jgi:hypothetical protein
MANSESIRFKEAQFYDNNQPLDLEQAIRKCCVFAGCLDFDFADDIDEAFANLDDWTTDVADGTTWSVATGALVATGGNGSKWYAAVHDTEVEPSFVASFDYTSGEGGFFFHGKNGTTDAYLVWWNATHCGISLIAADQTATGLISVPHVVTAGRLQVAAKWKLDSADGDRKFLCISLFEDGQCVVGYSDDVGETSQDWTGEEIGFAVYDGDTMTVDNLTVSSLARLIEYVSVDTGETPAAGMARAIGSTRLRYMVRYDGTIRIWRQGNRDEDWAIPATRRVTRHMDRISLRTMPTHVRLVGAIEAVDRFDDSQGDVHMHRFILHDDPNLMSEQEGYKEAGFVINDALERQTPVRLQMAGNPLVEPFDRVGYDGTSLRVVKVHLSYAVTGVGVVNYAVVLDCQGYNAV